MPKFLLVLFIFCCSHLTAQETRTLTPEAQVSLLTVSPGTELYSTFGHSALRVYDPGKRIDRIYNYGTFDFDQPNFYLNFCRGKLLYSLNIEPNRSFERGNLAESRFTREQVLALTAPQINRLFNLLEDNALAENRNYKYDFFYDNCATRIRDVLGTALFEQIAYDTTVAAQGITLRQMLRPHLENAPWTRFGIDLILGVPADKVASTRQMMFLPYGLHDAFAKARLGNGQPLVTGERLIPVDAHVQSLPAPKGPGAPFWVMCAVAVLGIATMFHARAARIFDFLFWLILGIAGLVITFLWFFTDHGATKTNLNLFWALPTHLLIFYRSKRTAFTELYFMVTGIVAALLLFTWTFLPQALPAPAFPLLVLILVKGLFYRYAISGSKSL